MSATLGAAARDRHLHAALVAGPLAWLSLWMLGLPLAPGLAASALLYGVLVGPLLEEIVFRGALQGWLLERAPLRRRALGVSGANAVTSLAFAAAHLWSQPPVWAAAVLAPSLVFGHLRERHDGIATAFLVHAFYNAGFLALFVGR